MSSDAKAQHEPPSPDIAQALTLTAPGPSTPLSNAGGRRPLPPVGIAIMGTTGSGKSSFINACSNSQLRIGNDLMSCTADVELSKEFFVDGRRVFLIDTPGFDDTNVSDADILKKIAAFLAVTYERGHKLAGIIYIHRISDVRFAGASTRNLRMFLKLCGEDAMKNVIFVTNMWGVLEKHVEERHEKQLIDTHFKPALQQGAQTARHYNTTRSAHEIVSRIIKNTPTTLLIQKELVDEHKGIENTSAGESVNEELNKAIKRHEAEAEELREEMRKALEEKDEQGAKELREEADKLRKQIDEARAEGTTIGTKYNEERKRMETAIVATYEEERKRIDTATRAAEYEEERKRMETAMAARYEEEQKKTETAMAARYEEERKRMETAMAARCEEEQKRMEMVTAAKYEERKRRETATTAAKYDEEQKRTKTTAKDEDGWRMEMAAIVAKYDEERKRMETAMAAKFEEERKRMETAMAARYDEERKGMEKAMQKMQEQARQERQKAHGEHTEQINELKAKLEGGANASADEREELLRRIHELECRQPNPSPKKFGLCVVI